MKKPRQYATEIVKLKRQFERREALAKVPDHIREWVKDLVVSHFERKRFSK